MRTCLRLTTDSRMTTEVEFIDGVRELVLSCQDDDGGDTFGAVWIAPYFDEEDIKRIPRFPCAVVVPLGGNIDQHNGSLYNGRFGIVVVNVSIRDTLGDMATRELMRIGHELMRVAKFSRESDIYLVSSSDIEVGKSQSGQTVVSRMYEFEYKIILDEILEPEA